MKIHGRGKAEILNDIDERKIYRSIEEIRYKLFWTIATLTGERWGAIRQLHVTDCYANPSRSIPHTYITFRSVTRKADPKGRRLTRQVPINDRLRRELQAYRPPVSGYLFPSPSREGEAICSRECDRFLRLAIAKCRLEDRGYSTHSTRRTFITKLHAAGVDIRIIKEITGHQSLAVLSGYIDVSPDRVMAAIALL